jgi:type II secretory pathway pseudopilin PulG
MVITILAILALIVVPRLYIPVDNAKRATMTHNLKTIQHALEIFRTDMGVYPYELSDLTKDSVSGMSDSTRTTAGFVEAGFGGPYLVVHEDPVDMLPRNPFIGNTSDDLTRHWTYDHEGTVESGF